MFPKLKKIIVSTHVHASISTQCITVYIYLNSDFTGLWWINFNLLNGKGGIGCPGNSCPALDNLDTRKKEVMTCVTVNEQETGEIRSQVPIYYPEQQSCLSPLEVKTVYLCIGNNLLYLFKSD